MIQIKPTQHFMEPSAEFLQYFHLVLLNLKYIYTTTQQHRDLYCLILKDSRINIQGNTTLMLVTDWQLFRNSLVTVKHLTSLSISTFENMKLRFTKLIQSLSKSEPIATTSSDTDDWCQGLQMSTLKMLGNKGPSSTQISIISQHTVARHTEGTDV